MSERERERLSNGRSQAETGEERVGRCWAWAGLGMGWLGTGAGAASPVVWTPPPTNTLVLLHQHSPEMQEIFSLQLTLWQNTIPPAFFLCKKCPSKLSRWCLRKRGAAGSGTGIAERALGKRMCRHSGLTCPCSWRANKSRKNNSEMSASEH